MTFLLPFIVLILLRNFESYCDRDGAALHPHHFEIDSQLRSRLKFLCKRGDPAEGLECRTSAFAIRSPIRISRTRKPAAPAPMTRSSLISAPRRNVAAASIPCATRWGAIAPVTT